MKYGIAEMLKMVAEAPSGERVEKLRRLASHHQALVSVLCLALDPAIEFDFTPGWVPEYAPSPYFDQEGALHQQMRFMDKFLKGGRYPSISEEKRRLLFTFFLEALDAKDAELMTAVKDKRLPYGLTRSLVDEAFPGLLPPVPVQAELAFEEPKPAKKPAKKTKVES